MDKKVLVIGLGSMGKRRVRCLLTIGNIDITGFDIRESRTDEASKLYQIKTGQDFDKILSNSSFDAWIISVPPDLHHIYIKKAIELGIPAFIEASVVDTDLKEMIHDSRSKNIVLAPSCTMLYHPAIKKISEIVTSGELGTISLFLYHSGQFLPDWHTYEHVSDYYVSSKETGGAREIVPFELTWITQLLGFPTRVVGFHKKTIEIEGAEEIDDTYSLLMDYPGFIFNLTVDVVSRAATRRLTINGSKKQLYWDWENAEILIFDPLTNKSIAYKYEVGSAQPGYNANIAEGMYVEEINAFLAAAFEGKPFPNSLILDEQVLNILYAAEKSSNSNQITEL